MDIIQWKDSIARVLAEIADENYQRKFWIEGDSKIVASFEETINRLFDDLNFNEFILEFGKLSVDSNLSSELANFRDLLDEFLTNQDEITNPRTIIDDVAWVEVRHSAAKVLERLKRTKI